MTRCLIMLVKKLDFVPIEMFLGGENGRYYFRAKGSSDFDKCQLLISSFFLLVVLDTFWLRFDCGLFCIGHFSFGNQVKC